MFCKVDFACDDNDETQSVLNDLYNYRDDISTKVLHRGRITLFCSLMQELIDRDLIDSFDTAIDIGCNAGAYARIISDFGFRDVLGIDVVAEFIDTANRFFAFSDGETKLTYRIENAEHLDTSRKFDFVLCTEVIEHTDDPARVIENIQDIMAPNGVAIISLPNSISLPFTLIWLRSKIRKRPLKKTLAQHLNYPFYRSIKSFNANDVRIVKTSGTNLVLGGIVLRALYRTPLFATINQMNFHLSRMWPLKFFSQFFFIVLKK